MKSLGIFLLALVLGLALGCASPQDKAYKAQEKVHNERLKLIEEYKNSGIEVTAPTKVMPVIFRPTATWSLLYRLIEGVRGNNYAKDITPLKKRLNEQIFSDKVSVWDDPTMEFATGSVPFDDEGVPTSKKVIVDKGVLKNFIFDLDSTNGTWVNKKRISARKDYELHNGDRVILGHLEIMVIAEEDPF